MTKQVMTILLVLSLGGCVQSRSPQPVMVKQAGDKQLGCDQVAIEYKTNTEVALNKISKNQAGDNQDMLLGFFIWPGLADFKNADGTEGNALLDRNIFLREKGKQLHCVGMEHWPAQPERYN